MNYVHILLNINIEKLKIKALQLLYLVHIGIAKLIHLLPSF